MGYKVNIEDFNSILEKLREEYKVVAPKVFKGEGTFSDTDRVRYGEIQKAEDISFDQKSHFSFKEVLIPQSETLFYFTEDEIKEADGPQKGIIVFLRSCDIHGVKRMDDIYLRNGFEDYYYKRIREKTQFILMGCEASFENCFCISMETNQSENYDAYVKVIDQEVEIESKWDLLTDLVNILDCKEEEILPDYVTENNVKVVVSDAISVDLIDSKMWEEYNTRCTSCGRCNFVCPTCTCFTMQDIFYQDNGKVGERRRVWSSCQVDGFTEMAGGHCFRGNKGDRMRFKTLHKVYDYKKRWGYHMCVGCGRCDDICPEYISFSNCINKLEVACKEAK